MEDYLYNQEIKEKFLSTLPEGTAKTFSYAFYRSHDLEVMLKKDVYDFTKEEILDVIKSANHTTMNSARLTLSVFQKYLDWAVPYKKGGNINQIANIGINELESFISTDQNLFINEMQLIELEDRCINYQDSVILRLIFEGVLGYRGTEITNLNYYDVDWNHNKLSVKDDRTGERDLNISDRCLKFIRRALDETEYTSYNETELSEATRFKLEEGDTIVKRALVGRIKKAGKPIDIHTAYRRITALKNREGIPYLTPMNIRYSGMIKMGVDLYKRDGKLEIEQLTEIAEQFAHKNFSYIKENVNAENIKKLYGVDIKA